MIDDTGFGFLLIVGIVAIFLGGLVWHMLNARQRGDPER